MRNLNDIAIFAQVVEAGGLTAAAKNLHMSTSQVSRRLRTLEEDLGIQLIARSTRHISLTEAGSHFYKKCAPALITLSTAQTDMDSASDVPTGTLRVHSAPGIGAALVTDAVVAFKSAYPDVAIELSIDSDRENLIRDGYDIAITTTDILDTSLISEGLGVLRHVVVASSKYLREVGRPKSPRDLKNFNCLLQYGRRQPGEWHFIGAKGEYVVKVSGSFRSTNAYSICKAAISGVGVALIPEYVFTFHPGEPGLEILFDDCVAGAREVKVFYARSQHPPAKIKAFLKYLRAANEERLAHKALLEG